MAWPRDPNAGAQSQLADHPITIGLGTVVLAALVLLFALRHLFGSVRVEAGTK